MAEMKLKRRNKKTTRPVPQWSETWVKSRTTGLVKIMMVKLETFFVLTKR